jgi:hypothetical protein
MGIPRKRIQDRGKADGSGTEEPRQMPARGADFGSLAGDLDRTIDRLEAAGEVYRAALRRYRAVAGERGIANDPRAPMAEYERYVVILEELPGLLRKYHKLIVKRTIGDRNRSSGTVVRRYRRICRLMDLQSGDPLFAPINSEEDADARRRTLAVIEATGRMLSGMRQLIDRIEKQGLERKQT